MLFVYKVLLLLSNEHLYSGDTYYKFVFLLLILLGEMHFVLFISLSLTSLLIISDSLFIISTGVLC